MNRLSSTADLLALARQLRKRAAESEGKKQVRVHLGTCGISSGADKVLDAFLNEVGSQRIPDVTVSKAGCIGICEREPVVTVVDPQNGKTVYANVTRAGVSCILKEHLLGGRIVPDMAVDLDAPYFKRQEIRVMHSQDIDPMDVGQYIAKGGYQALARVLTEMTPDQVIGEVRASGLRGRGGAGFPTAIKWGFVRNAVGDEKHVVCNGDEGDPGAYMNRAVLEGNPHSVIEGMAIGAFAIGNVRKGYAYVRAEYPLAIKTLQNAIDQAYELGLLGKNVLGTGFEFYVEIFPGAGAFVCGEETALLTSIEGKRGNPRPRPPFPANKGLFGKPTALNNVETWSNVPQIILNGAAWFGGVGTEKSRGTKTFCLVGKVNNTGLVEVPLGTSMREIIFDIGGGIPNGKEFKAAQIGGPSGGVIPAKHLDTPVDYESVPALGAIMGSGGLVVMDEDTCMVDVAKFFLEFTMDESCGKCTPCRAGIPKMRDILEKITSGQGTTDDLEVLTELSQMIASSSLCGLGQTAPNPVLSTLRHFREEYEAHILEKRCPAGVCRALISFYILADKCQGCMICARKCPVQAIRGGKGLVHVIDQSLCTRCGTCYEVCPARFGAIAKVSGEKVAVPAEPIPVPRRRVGMGSNASKS